MKMPAFARVTVALPVRLVLALALAAGCAGGPPVAEPAGETASATASLQVGQVVHGFKLTRRQAINEIQSVGLLFEHVKTGARLLKLEAPDSNRTFDIVFETPPDSRFPAAAFRLRGCE